MGFLSKLFGNKKAQSQSTSKNQPSGKPAAQPPQPAFYVFGLQGPGFGQAQAGDIMPEKAQKLKEEYAPAANMELKLIRPAQWGGQMKVSTPMNGLIQTSINIEDHLPAIRNYLQRKGFKTEAIEKAISAAEDNQLILSNPFSGVTVIGIPME